MTTLGIEIPSESVTESGITILGPNKTIADGSSQTDPKKEKDTEAAKFSSIKRMGKNEDN